MDLHLRQGWNASTYALALGTKVARIWHRIKEERFYQYVHVQSRQFLQSLEG